MKSFISRHWVFPGVRFHPARYSDVVAVLMDMGYFPDEPKEKKEVDEGKITVKLHLLQPGQEPAELFIWIQLTEELTTTTTRERKLEEEETYRTEISTRVLAIDFYAQMDGGVEILTRDAENLMQRLKDQFTAVVDLR